MSTSPKQDYTNYTHADLLRRVSELETRLRDLNINGLRQPSPPSKTKKPKKAPKPFDPSRYHTRLIALKFAYLGGAYNGFEHHTNNTTPLPTVEEELWKALQKTKLIFPDFAAAGRSGHEDEVCWEGCEYSKCGRTDRGVSAFGQVIGVRVRSSRPKVKAKLDVEVEDVGASVGAEMKGEMNGMGSQSGESTKDAVGDQPPDWDSICDELPYISTLNRVLPPDIRIFAWCPHPPPDFSARFSCKERRYRYFFTNPSYATVPGYDLPGRGGGMLDIAAMQTAAKKLEGLHDFRNLCKVDPSKQLSSFERRIFHAGIHAVSPSASASSGQSNGSTPSKISSPDLYYFEVRGSAFLWHQVRHMIGVLFLVGQGYESSDIVDKLLDIEKSPGKPVYDMADDQPLVLWDCIFPDPALVPAWDGPVDEKVASKGYEDALDWVYVGDEAGGCEPSKRIVPGVDDGLFGRNGVMDDLWSLWRKRKMDEVLAGSLMDIVASLDQRTSKADAITNGHAVEASDRSDRIFDGSERPRTVGKYVPLMKREKLETPDVVNARYAARKGLQPREAKNADGEADGAE